MEQKLFASLDQILQCAVPPELKAKGWRYLDFNARFSPQMWDWILFVIGDGEYKLLVTSQGTDDGVPWKRGQFLISPQGYANLQDPQRRASMPYPTNETPPTVS